MTDQGTSSRVGKQRPVYPSAVPLLAKATFHTVRTAAILAALCVFVVNNADVGLPALERWFLESSGVPGLLQTNEYALKLDAMFFQPSGNATSPVAAMAKPIGGAPKTLLECTFFIVATTIIHCVLYYGVNSIFAVMDALNVLPQFKLPRTPRMLASRGLIVKTIIESVFNTFVTQPPSMFLLYVFCIRFGPFFATPADGLVHAWPELVLHFVCAQLVNDIGFYIVHRLVHEIPGAYPIIHKQHHKYVGSIGFAAEYAHPLEHLLANQLPTIGYCFFLAPGLHPSVWITYLVFRTLETYESHSGYCFADTLFAKLGLTFADRAEFHDWHHTDNRGAYGAYWIDCLLGTCDSFLLHKQKKAAAKKSAALKAE